MGQYKMRKLHVVCPICLKSKRIGIPVEIFNIDEGSLLKMPIKPGVICDHAFIMLIDYNFAIRDYEVISNPKELENILTKSKGKNERVSFSYF